MCVSVEQLVQEDVGHLRRMGEGKVQNGGHGEEM